MFLSAHNHFRIYVWSSCIAMLFIICIEWWNIPRFLHQNRSLNNMFSLIFVSTTETKNKRRAMTDNISNSSLVPLLRNNPGSIIFIKTHKTASSSITNLLHTYTVRHKKSCPLFDPKYAGMQFNFDENDNMHKQIVSNAPTWNGDKSLNLWLNHAIFSDYLYELMPSSSNQIMSIVRNPNDRFLSSWMNFALASVYNMNLSTFIAETFDENKEIVPNKRATAKRTETRLNAMCRELIPGYVQNGMDKYGIWQRIQSGDFLLLITDRWDESLILLKYAYNLQWNDLFYSNMTKKSWKRSPIKAKETINITKTEQQQLRSLNDCDWTFYDLAMKIFDRRLFEIYKGDDDMLRADIDTMHKVQMEERDKCLYGLHETEIEKRLCESVALDNRQWNQWALALKT